MVSHVPPWHLNPPGHTVSQVPQWVLSLLRSTHSLRHGVIPGSQVHSPPWHVDLAGHTVWQSPQWSFSLLRSTHPSGHCVSPDSQVHVPPLQVPFRHCVPSGTFPLHFPCLRFL